MHGFMDDIWMSPIEVVRGVWMFNPQPSAWEGGRALSCSKTSRKADLDRGFMQRRHVILILHFHMGAPAYQERSKSGMALKCCQMQWSSVGLYSEDD